MTTDSQSTHEFLMICVRCERDVVAPRAWIGREVQCPFCASVLRVPQPTPGIRAVPADRPSLAPQRFFNFACPRCDVLIEAHTGFSGREAHCPTCGVGLRVPHVDPVSGLPLPSEQTEPPDGEFPTPLHAYAASGELAPRIIRQTDGSSLIRCPGCQAESPMDAERCVRCGLPFTLDAAPTGTSGRRRAVSIAAFTLGLIGLSSVYLPFLMLPSALGLILGLRAFAETRGETPWLGILGGALGFVGLTGGVIGFALL